MATKYIPPEWPSVLQSGTKEQEAELEPKIKQLEDINIQITKRKIHRINWEKINYIEMN